MWFLEDEVAKLKDWAASCPKTSPQWEADYEGWKALRAAADDVLEKAQLDDREIELLLYALARDNDHEYLRGMIEEHPEAGMVLARAATAYPDRDARWQIAVFLGTRDSAEARDLLRGLTTDADEYVRRRALSAISRLDPDFATLTALGWLSADHEYSRLAALTILHDLEAPQLADALERLECDISVHVRRTVAKLRGRLR